jgi:hypothetical protein
MIRSLPLRITLINPPRIIAMINNGHLTPIHYDGGYVIASAEIEGYVRKKGGKQPGKKASCQIFRRASATDPR